MTTPALIETPTWSTYTTLLTENAGRMQALHAERRRLILAWSQGVTDPETAAALVRTAKAVNAAFAERLLLVKQQRQLLAEATAERRELARQAIAETLRTMGPNLETLAESIAALRPLAALVPATVPPTHALEHAIRAWQHHTAHALLEDQS